MTIKQQYNSSSGWGDIEIEVVHCSFITQEKVESINHFFFENLLVYQNT